MAEDMEIELKLEIDPADAGRLTADPLLAGATPAEMRLEATYFDTPGHTLHAAGYSLRVRREGRRHVQTVKAEGAMAAGLFVRPEHERVISDDTPVIDHATLPLGDMPLEGLAPLFRTAVARSRRLIDFGGAAIELVLDIGAIVAPRQRSSVSELELELKGGDPAGLFALARALDRVAPVRLGVLSKSERGYRLVKARGGRPVKAETARLTAEMSSADAFRAIAATCIRQFRLNEALLGGRHRGGALHQARVGLRRLRSAISLFKPMLGGDAQAERLRGELRWLAGMLGEARNLDVLIDRVADPALRRRLGRARAAAYRAATEALDSPRTRALMLDLVEWLAVGSWPAIGGEEADAPIALAAAHILDRHRRRLKRRGNGLAGLDDHHRHQARIEAKKLRYAVEFFAPLYEGRKARRRLKAFLDSLETLQTHLGDLNDLATAPAVFAALGIGEEAVGALAGAGEADRARLLAKAEQAHEALIGAKRFWR